MVPPRRRHRSGYRPGQSSPELKAAITAEGEHLTRLEEPLVVIKAVGDTFAALDDALAEIALPRLKANAALRRDGWSYDKIAEATSLSKGPGGAAGARGPGASTLSIARFRTCRIRSSAASNAAEALRCETAWSNNAKR